MDIKDLQKSFNEWGKIDPFFTILSWKGKRRKWQIDEFFATGKQEIDELMKYLNNLGVKFYRHKALDFGCGVGRLTQFLADYFDEVHGVDIAESMIDLANKYNLHSNTCHYHLNNVDNLQIFQQETFDFIYSNITLQHMEPRYSKKYILEFLRLLVPGGLTVFYLITPRPSPKNIFVEFRKNLRLLTPKIFSNLYRKLRYGSSVLIEMYPVDCHEIVESIKDNGGEILDLIPEIGRYTIRKL